MTDTIVITTGRSLAELEAVIERGMANFLEMGAALTEIRDRRVYKETHHSFDAYLAERWGFTRQRASQLITAAKVSTMVDSSNERQARAKRIAPPVETVDATMHPPSIRAEVSTVGASASEEPCEDEGIDIDPTAGMDPVAAKAVTQQDEDDFGGEDWREGWHEDDPTLSRTEGPSVTFRWYEVALDVQTQGEISEEMWLDLARRAAGMVGRAAWFTGAAARPPAVEPTEPEPTERDRHTSLLLETMAALPAKEAQRFRRAHRIKDERKWVAGLSDADIASALRLLGAVEDPA